MGPFLGSMILWSFGMFLSDQNRILCLRVSVSDKKQQIEGFQPGISRLYIIVGIHYSGWKPLKYNLYNTKQTTSPQNKKTPKNKEKQPKPNKTKQKKINPKEIKETPHLKVKVIN